MVVSEAIRREIEEKVELYDAAKEKIKAKIENNIKVVVEKLKIVRGELLDEVEEEFGKNPFAEFLGNNNNCTDADAKRLLDEQKIPENLGPDEKSFSTLLKDINSLKEWRIFAPKNLKAKSITWDSITLTWDKLADAISYQIEVDRNNSWDTSTTNSFTKRRLLPETEHIFRVRAVGGSSVSKWSDAVKGKTLKKWECVWKKCPDDVDDGKKYAVDERNPRVATKINYGVFCTIIGNISIPLNRVISWNIKILKSDNGYGIYVGVASPDINQNDGYKKCGWYLNCFSSSLYSGPPHSYSGKEYGPRKENWKGQYVHTGDSVGVLVDTTKGDLSFVLNGVNRGVAFEGIPFDKPLVPCVLLIKKVILLKSSPKTEVSQKVLWYKSSFFEVLQG